MDFSLPRPFAPGSESSRCGTFALWNFRSHKRMYQGAIVPPICIGLRVRNCHCHRKKIARIVFFHHVIRYSIIRNYGLFAPKTIRSRERKFQVWNFRSLELSLLGTFAPWNFRSLELSLPPTNVGLAKQVAIVPPISIGLRVRNCHCPCKKIAIIVFFLVLNDIA